MNFSDEEDSEEYLIDRSVAVAQSSKISDLFGLKSEDLAEAPIVSVLAGISIGMFTLRCLDYWVENVFIIY